MLGNRLSALRATAGAGVMAMAVPVVLLAPPPCRIGIRSASRGPLSTRSLA
jgi:hypothetical protein